MRNFHNNHHFPKVIKEHRPSIKIEFPDEFEAQDSLFEISKIEDHHLLPQENFIQEFYTKEKPVKKRSQVSSMSLPKKKEIEEKPSVTPINTFRQTMTAQNLNGTPITITNYLIMSQQKQCKRNSIETSHRNEKSSIQEQVNRKAKYLFRLRNKNKLPSLSEPKPENFHASFYCHKIGNLLIHN